LTEDTNKIETYLENARQKKRITHEQILQLDAERKVLQAKTKEELSISPENEMKIRELEERLSDVEMEFKDLSEKYESATAVIKDLENQ